MSDKQWYTALSFISNEDTRCPQSWLTSRCINIDTTELQLMAPLVGTFWTLQKSVTSHQQTPSERPDKALKAILLLILFFCVCYVSARGQTLAYATSVARKHPKIVQGGTEISSYVGCLNVLLLRVMTPFAVPEADSMRSRVKYKYIRVGD